MRYLRIKQMCLIGLVMMLALLGCSRDNHAHPNTITNKQLFDIHCADCHGSGGTGSILLGTPANKETGLLNYQIRKKIKKGSGGDSKMPVFHTMPEKEVSRIITYLRTLPSASAD